MKVTILSRAERWGVVRRAVGMWLVLTLAFGTVVIPEAWAADYYVDTGGSDGNDGLSTTSPWKTLTHALVQVASGDVIHVAAGTYDTSNNGETFPLALKDGVVILGDVDDPSQVVIRSPGGTSCFFNNDTALSSSTRLAGVTLEDDGTADTNLVLVWVGSATISPRIDHNVFKANSTYDNGIRYRDLSSDAGTFRATIDHNVFDGLGAGVWNESVGEGQGQVFSPVILNNTFTGCSYPVAYTMKTSAEGTVGGRVEDNTFENTGTNDVFADFDPEYGAGSLLFDPTITGNDMQSGAGTNVKLSLYGYSYEGNVKLAPVITDNTMDGTDFNVLMEGYYNDMDGDYTVAPTISGNTMTGASRCSVRLSLTTMSVSDSAERNVISPTITNNTITANGGEGVWISLTDWSGGQLEGAATISGNTVTGASWALDWEMSEMSDGDGMDLSVVISNNTVTSPTHAGIYFSMESMSFSDHGNGSTFNLAMEGNTITDAGDYGIVAYPAYSWNDENSVDETVLIRGNTVTGSAKDGMYLSFSDQTSNTLDARVTDNVIKGNDQDGLYVESNDLGSNGIQVSCNTITDNGDNGIRLGDGNDPPADFGGGSLSSPGNNILTGNGTNGTVGQYDFYNEDDADVRAESNWWGTTDETVIDSHIRDDNEASGIGHVDFANYLSAAPSVSVSATLTASVANDVAPPGPSWGDTLEYTAQITVSGCGDASASFTAPVDANTTVVPGSVTTTRGIVQSDDPPKVAVGVIDPTEAVTVTWQVVVNGGTSVETQGTVAATKTGSTLTDDPNQPGTSDPTVTAIHAPSPGTVQFAEASYSVGEGDGSVTLTATRTGGSDGAVTVSYTTMDGTAVAPGDYTPTSGSLSWADGDTGSRQIVVPIVDDAVAEGNESFTVELSNPPGSSFVGDPATAVVTIRDNEPREIPVLGSWGVTVFAGLILLLGVGVLRRRWAGAALAVLLAVLLAVPAMAAKPRAGHREVYAGAVASVQAVEGRVTLELEGGRTITVPEAVLVVREGHVRGAKGERAAAQAPGPRAVRHTGHGVSLLAPGRGVLVKVKRDRESGEIRRVKVLTYASAAQAQAELARREARKARRHPPK
ncbi:MAG: DUF1565 domain-containing protein [Acidobacteria bacterium]|nr:DUF1565 domain-containing protein [Acidobacteriota bacterium]